MAEREPDPQRRRTLADVRHRRRGPPASSWPDKSSSSRAVDASQLPPIDPTEARIVLLDAASTILGGYPASLQRRAARRAGAAWASRSISDAGHGRGRARDRHDRRGSRTATDRGRDQDLGRGSRGVAAGPHGRRGGGRRIDRAGRVQVGPDCTLPGYPEVFVIGDMMSLDHLPGMAGSRSSRAGMQPTRSCAAWTATPRERPFRYRDHGNDGNDFAVPGHRHIGTSARFGVPRLDAVARRTPGRTDRVQEPGLCALNWTISSSAAAGCSVRSRPSRCRPAGSARNRRP